LSFTHGWTSGRPSGEAIVETPDKQPMRGNFLEQRRSGGAERDP
jgi:hypothetical protein